MSFVIYEIAFVLFTSGRRLSAKAILFICLDLALKSLSLMCQNFRVPELSAIFPDSKVKLASA